MEGTKVHLDYGVCQEMVQVASSFLKTLSFLILCLENSGSTAGLPFVNGSFAVQAS